MCRFSLIVATMGRTEELGILLASIVRQQRQDVELIVVDQNDDERVPPLLASLPKNLRVQHVRIAEKNVSRARNAGIAQARGDILAFPDDDCWYPLHLLDEVDTWFREHGDYSVLSVGAVDNEGIPSGNRWIQHECDITPFNSIRTTFCSSLFIALRPECMATSFDENVNRGEETDFVLRLLATGLRGRFDRRLHVHHPRRDMLSGTVTPERAWSYGAGMGRLVRRHSLFFLWFTLLAYDAARAAIVFVCGQRNDARFCWSHTQGLFWGFVDTR